MRTKEELIELALSFNPDVDTDLIGKSYELGFEKHDGQMRASGDPYFSHPVEVAALVIEMKMDVSSICTALLHDTVEDTDTTLEDIKELFGEEISKLIDGMTKLSKIQFQSAQEKQAENFRKLVLAMSEDIRVLIIKLADRMHNMRTLHFIPKKEKQKRIALETIEIYAPLAERIGIHKIKTELEDLCFNVLNHDARESIMTRLKYLRAEGGEQVIKSIVDELNKKLVTADVEANVYGREKTKYSIWQKMQRKNISFEQLSDIMAFRLIVESVADCYNVLGVIHSLYPTVPGRFKDYISLPKPNGYRSLHTTVIGPHNHRIEIQIRTSHMHEEAELGVAAHWLYKQDDEGNDKKQYRWLRELMDVMEHANRPEEVMENTKLELYQDQVFCFTPNGDLIPLPRRATPVDFAYAVHSKLGDTTVGAKVNGRIVPLNTQLINGDQVEVSTSKKQTPSPNWERFVVTGKAKSRVRRFIRLQKQEEYMNLGKAMLQKVFKHEGCDFSEKVFTPEVCKQFKMENYEALLVNIGSGNAGSREVFYAIHPEFRPKEKETTVISLAEDLEDKSKRVRKKKGKQQPMPIKGLVAGMALHFARCCHPLPGDKIVGIVTTGKGVTIHTTDCETLESFADTPERWLDVSWDNEVDTQEVRVGRLNVTLNHSHGALAALTAAISKAEGDIMNLKITNRSTDFWDLIIDLQVKNATHLKDIISVLRLTREINSVHRAKNR